jgi:hypothetical protein
MAGESMKSISRKTATVRVEDLDGVEHELQELWSDQPVVLVFLRHFG